MQTEKWGDPVSTSNPRSRNMLERIVTNSTKPESMQHTEYSS